MMNTGVHIPSQAFQELCRKYSVKELSVFGSRARGDHGDTSDLDLLVDFLPESDIDLLDFIHLKLDLETLLGISVDLVERAALKPRMRLQVLLNRVPSMRSSKDRLLDIAEACELVIRFSEKLKTLDDTLEVDAFENAILHQLTIIGETASRVDEPLRLKYSNIDWSGIIAFRNILVHDYFGVQWDRVWKVIFDHLPDLLDDVREILSKEFPE